MSILWTAGSSANLVEFLRTLGAKSIVDGGSGCLLTRVRLFRADLNGFEDLTVSPPAELLGQEVKFLLGGTVESTTTDYYAIIAPDGSILSNEPIGIPIFRTVQLDFPSRP